MAKNPRNIRNWWLEIINRGKGTGVEFGPRGKDGSFSIKVFQRRRGKVARIGCLQGTPHDDGVLELRWIPYDDGQYYLNESIVLAETIR